MTWLLSLFRRADPEERAKRILRARLLAVAVGRASYERGALSP